MIRSSASTPTPTRPPTSSSPPPVSSTPPESRLFFKFKETEQYHVSMGSLGIPAKSEDRYAMAALNNVLGGGMSSRLFQEVREKRGLAYAVYSYHQGYS